MEGVLQPGDGVGARGGLLVVLDRLLPDARGGFRTNPRWRRQPTQVGGLTPRVPSGKARRRGILRQVRSRGDGEAAGGVRGRRRGRHWRTVTRKSRALVARCQRRFLDQN